MHYDLSGSRKTERSKRRERTLTSRINYRHPVTSLFNYVAVRVCYSLGSNWVVGYPSKILFEPTNLCNLKCPLCPRGVDQLKRPDGSMTFDQFRSIIDEVRPYTTHMEFAGYGEPFMHAGVCEMVRYASDAGIMTNMHTNANLIDTQEKVHALVTSGLHHLTLSIDGATQEVYQKYRVGGTLETVLANVRALITERRRLRRHLPIITVQVVVTKNNEHQVDELRAVAEDLGADHFRAKKANITVGRPRKVTSGLIAHWIPQQTKFNRFFLRQDKRGINGCGWLYKNTSIYWNGDVTTCCYDATNMNSMGNIFKAGSFWAIWNGERYRALRRQVNADISKAAPLCNVCPARTVIEPTTAA